MWAVEIENWKFWCRRFKPVPAHHSFHPLAGHRILPDLSLCPDLPPTQAHSSTFQRTSNQEIPRAIQYPLEGRFVLVESPRGAPDDSFGLMIGRSEEN